MQTKAGEGAVRKGRFKQGRGGPSTGPWKVEVLDRWESSRYGSIIR